ncbi:MAG: hypothetical protein ACEY3D_06070 [Rickettsia sp.]
MVTLIYNNRHTVALPVLLHGSFMSFLAKGGNPEKSIDIANF